MGSEDSGPWSPVSGNVGSSTISTTTAVPDKQGLGHSFWEYQQSLAHRQR